MEPISLILGALVVSAAACTVPKAIADAYASYRAARDGRWDVVERGRARPGFFDRLGAAWGRRREARNRQAGGSGDYRPGVGAYAKDLYHGFFEDLLERRQAKRAARAPYVYDPNRPSWAQRVDAAVLRGARRAREGWDRTAEQGEAQRRTSGGETPTARPVAPDVEGLPPGTWTVGDKGEWVPLVDEVAPEPPAAARPSEPEPDEHQGVVDVIHGTDQQQEEPMTAPATTPQATAAAEVNTNEDARRNFTDIANAAGEAADALAAYEAAQARLAAAAQAGADGMAAKAFDGNATTAQFDINDLLSATAMSGAAAAIDGIKQQADNGVKHLDKYRDSEAQVAEERIDPTVLASTSS